MVKLDGEWFSEQQLRDEWKNNPDPHSSNCYEIADLTPQKVEKVYRDSLK